MAIQERAAPTATGPKTVAAPKAVTAQTKLAPKAPDVVKLELAQHNSYTKDGVRYEKGVVYEFTRDQADIVLEWESELGIPVFRRFKPKVIQTLKRAEDGRPIQSMAGKTVQAAVKKEEASGADAIYITDDEPTPTGDEVEV